MNRLVRYFWHHKLKGSPYQPLFVAPAHNEYVSLDCETGKTQNLNQGTIMFCYFLV